MKRFGYLLTLICVLLLSACKEDEPVLIIHGHTSTYTIEGDKTLVVTLNGVRITEKDGAIVFSTPDNQIGSLTLNAIIPGHDSVAIGGVVLTTLPDGNGIAFKGEAAISETEKIVFDGTIINFVLTIDIDTVPITAQS
ncbi:MAG: DUF4925 domain-containing protein [Muribaculaceae bacterium]|nr:DUF4925 domain-containing protein [Muribaculaceae bacterium]